MPLAELAVAFAVSVASVAVALAVPLQEDLERSRLAFEAAETMEHAMAVVRAARVREGPPIDPSVDVNKTGLIGRFYSPITTTVGHLEAKRTTTNPNFAGLIVHLLLQAGVKSGDFVAVGASGSLPALVIAILSAAEVLDVRVGLIVSLGSSQFGANDPDLTWLDIEQVLRSEAVFTSRSVAASLGGDLDIGRELSPEARASLKQAIEAAGIPLLENPVLETNVHARMSLIKSAAGEARIAAFVNVGGAWANLGVDSSIISMPPGLTDVPPLPAKERGGLIHSMAAQGVPVVHLLGIRELARQHGLPWDPSPLPAPSECAIRRPREPNGWDAAYLTVVIVWMGSVYLRRRSGKHRGSTSVEAPNPSSLP